MTSEKLAALKEGPSYRFAVNDKPKCPHSGRRGPMSRFDEAVKDGMRSGFERAWTDQCDGRTDPEERCPMKVSDGCACYYRAYNEAPFWRRWQMEKPRRPHLDAVLEAMIVQRVEEVLPVAVKKIRTAPPATGRDR